MQIHSEVFTLLPVPQHCHRYLSLELIRYVILFIERRLCVSHVTDDDGEFVIKGEEIREIVSFTVALKIRSLMYVNANYNYLYYIIILLFLLCYFGFLLLCTLHRHAAISQ